jgi:hypothetical protein
MTLPVAASMAASRVHREDPLRGVVVDDQIRVAPAHIHAADRGQRLEVEDRDGRVATVAGESPPVFRRQRDRMNARRVQDRPHQRVAARVDHLDPRAVRYVEAMSRAVYGEAVPPSLAPDGDPGGD